MSKQPCLGELSTNLTLSCFDYWKYESKKNNIYKEISQHKINMKKFLFGT